MIVYYIDTNFLLRFLLKDNLRQFNIAKKYINRAKSRDIVLVCVTEVVIEIEYVLRKLYKCEKKFIANIFSLLLKATYIHFPDREVIEEAIEIYARKNIDLLDIVLYFKAKKDGGKVLSFDKDFHRIA